MTLFIYQVIHDPGGTPIDITEFVERVEVVEIGTGEIRSAKIRVNAQFGRFVTNDFGGTLPIFDEFQKIQITITDENNDLCDNVYEIDNLKPLQNTQQGTVQEVDMLGQEQHLLRVPFSKPFFFESAFNVVRDICDFYNDPDSKGLGQPIISGQGADFDDSGGNDMPKTTANEYTFHITEQKCYEGLISTLDRMGSSVAAGGAGDFFDINFITDTSDVTFNTIGVQMFSSGNHPDQSLPITTIDDTLAVNPGEEEGGIEATKGTVTGTWGTDSFGTMPYENSDFQGALEAWNFSPNHIPAEFYAFESIVKIPSSAPDAEGDREHYKVNNTLGTVTQPPSVDWDQYFFSDFLSNEVGMAVSQYSKWTRLRDEEWQNGCASPDGSQAGLALPTYDNVAVFDSNLVVDDLNFLRTWVDIRAVDVSAIPGEYFYTGVASTTNLYRTFRILVDTNIGVPVAPLDNPSFANNVVEFSGPPANVFTLKREMFDDNFCAVINEGRVYELESGVWTDKSSQNQFNDCFHPLAFLFSTLGFNDKLDGTGGTFGDDSAVRFEFSYSRQDFLTGTFNQPSYYRSGAWACFRFPFPHNRFNGVSEVGFLYGDRNSPFVKKEPATVDTSNMHFASDGKIGYNHTNAEDLGPLDELVFKTIFQWRQNADGSGGLIPRGNLPCRCTLYDSADNVVVQDFTISFNNLWEEIRLPLRDFQIYRARTPWALGANVQNVFLQKLEILNVFQWKNLNMIAFQWQTPYDDEGRYAAWFQAGKIVPELQELNNLTGLIVNDFNIKWDFDLFEFSKPLLSLTSPITGAGERAMFPDFFEEPFISNKFQLDQSNIAKREVSLFRHWQYDITTTGRCDLKFGYSFFLENSALVNRADRNASPPDANNGDPNTIKLVVKRIVHVIDKPPTGPGGYLTTFTGVKRLES